MKILRWGRSAYETDAALAAEDEGLAALGCDVARCVGPTPPMGGVGGLVVTSKVQVSAAVMDAAPELRFVLTTTSGYEHIDLAAAAARGIAAGRCPIARRDAVVDTSLAMGLSLLRDMPSLHQRAREGIWARSELPARRMGRVRGLDVGLVGYGVIGRAAARAWAALGAKVRWHDPALPGSMPLDELLASSRVLSLHCGLTPSSEWIVDATALEKMPPGVILINTARGRCVDLEALAGADHLGGIGLDVFPTEPPPALAVLAARPNAILLPHAAGYHDDLGAEVAREVVDSVGRWLDGRGLAYPVSAPEESP